jgi:hypothetical protein
LRALHINSVIDTVKDSAAHIQNIWLAPIKTHV